MLPCLQGGLVVVDAKYGALEAITKAEVDERECASSSGAATSDAVAAASTEQAAGTSAGKTLSCTLIIYKASARGQAEMMQGSYVPFICG